MARLFHSGAEVDGGILNSLNATIAADGLRLGMGTGSRDTSVFRSGTASWKFDSTGSNFSATCSTSYAVAASTSYFVRAYLRAAANPSTAAMVLQLDAFLRVQLRTDGALELVVAGVVQGSPSSTITDSAWHRVEVKGTGTGTAWTAAELLVDGVSLATWSGSAVQNNPATTTWGWLTAPGANLIVNVDDVALNDSTGAANNGYPGDGKVVLLKPTADSAGGAGWTLGTGTALGGNAFAALDNTPPLGVADLAAGSDPKQLRNATANANVNVDVAMTTYTAAGVGASDTVNAVISWAATAAPVSTSAKQGTVGVVSNPAITNVAFGPDGTAGAFWVGAAAGTFPAGWKWSRGTVAQAPAVTRGTAPVMRITQVTSSTRIAVVCAMFLYVDYTPVVSGTAWTQPVNDTLSLADSVATQAGREANIPDTLAVADQLTSQAAFARTVPDTVAVADAQTVARNIAQAIVDTLPLADATALVRDIAQPVADTLALTDLASTAAGKDATVNDTVAVADAVRFDQGLTVADTVALTDVVSQAEEIHIADTLALSDLVDPVKTTGGVVLNQPVADTLSVADAVRFDRAATLADTVTATDQLSSQAGLQRALADTVAPADSTATQAALLRTVADTVALTDVVSPVKTAGATDWTVPLADTVPVTDTTASTSAYVRTVADTVPVADQLTATAGTTYTRPVADTVTVTDHVDFTSQRQLDFADTLGVLDEVSFVFEQMIPAGWITFATGNRIGVLYPGRLDTAAQTLGGITVPGQGGGELALTGVGGIARTGG